METTERTMNVGVGVGGKLGGRVAYVAGPLRNTDPQVQKQNVNRAVFVAKCLWEIGWTVICPHINGGRFEGQVKDELLVDGHLHLVERSDALWLMPGWTESAGTRGELELALLFGMEINVLLEVQTEYGQPGANPSLPFGRIQWRTLNPSPKHVQRYQRHGKGADVRAGEGGGTGPETEHGGDSGKTDRTPPDPESGGENKVKGKEAIVVVVSEGPYEQGWESSVRIPIR